MSSPLTTIIVVGATATGKTDLGIRLAESLQTEIINADSRQVYRHLDIGTAKPSAAQRGRVAHHLLDVVSPDQDYDAAQFMRAGRQLCGDLQRRGRVPLIVGGCGLYIRALVQGLFAGPKAEPGVREALQRRAASSGSKALHDELLRIDPISAAAIHSGDIVRIIRALEVYELTGTPMTELRRLQALQPIEMEARFIGLRSSRRSLRERIAQRAEGMVRQGLFEEVEGLLARGYDERCLPLQGFGYQHLLAAVRGALSAREAVRRLIRDTQRYAKRQETWFRRMPNIQWFDIDALRPDQLHTEIAAFLSRTGLMAG